MTQPLIVEIFKSEQQDEMYLYVEKSVGLKKVPDALMEKFGTAISVMTMLLKKEKKLARVEAENVMKGIQEKGFYLQMPPVRDDYMLDLYKAPTKAVY